MEQGARAEEDYFSKMLHSAIGVCSDRFVSSQEIIGFLPVEGRAYDGELMVVGRAVNGWEVGAFPPNAFTDVAFARKYAEDVLLASRGDAYDCPMKAMFDRWQCDGRKMPPFFSAIRAVVNLLGLIDDTKGSHWASLLVWSQLYKISPPRGNPTGELRHRQRCGLYNCITLLKMEIERHRPKRLLFLTGWKDWASDFLGKIAPGVSPVEMKAGRYVEALGDLQLGDHLTRIVVACRPEGRQLKPFSEQIASAFQG